MTTTQIQYQNLLESVFHNRQTEEQARKELSETQKHNRTTEKQTDYSNKSGRMTAQANVTNARANTRNAETNAKNLKVNQKNAATNALNAATNAKNAETNAKNAETNALKAKAYRDLTIAQIGKEEANTAKIWKDVSIADVNILTKTTGAGKTVAAAVVCGNILTDPKASPELKAFARSMIAQLKGDSSSNNKVIAKTAKGIKENKKTWANVQLIYKGGTWMFVPRQSSNTQKAKKNTK